MLPLHTRWILLCIACLWGAGMAWAVLGWEGWVQSWIGAVFRAASGGALGWAVSHYVVGLDLSEIEELETRAVAGLSQAVLIAGGAIAVAVGV